MHYSRFAIRLLWLTIFSIAMGFLESAVVLYLREIYYPSGFKFPLALMSGNLALTEVLREASTIIMLITVACLGGRNARQRIAWFIYCFAIWDIFYYVFLKLLLNWPGSLLTWDILFLIPMVWTGPVLAPLIVSSTMIIMAGVLLSADKKVPRIKIRWPVFMPVITGSILVLLSFILDFSRFMLQHYPPVAFLHADIIRKATQYYIPVSFNWWLFITGELVIFSGLTVYFFYPKFMVKT